MDKKLRSFLSAIPVYDLAKLPGVIAFQLSNLAAIDYDWSGTLTIAFHSGGVYEYYGVPESEYTGLMNASSHGQYFHSHIKGRYSCRKIAG